MDGSISLDVDDISDLVDLQQGGHGGHSILAEWTSEHVTRAAAITLGIRHLCFLVFTKLTNYLIEKNQQRND